MKQTTLAYELSCDITISLTDTFLPYSIFLVQPLFASFRKEAASTIFYTFGMVRSPNWKPQPPALKANSLPTELS